MGRCLQAMGADTDLYEGFVSVPKAVRFPVELHRPPRFAADDPATWPRIPGRLEYVGGKLLYMTPSGDIQQDVTGSIAGILDDWLELHPEFTFGTNEAGMILDGEVRAADAAVWRRAALGGYTGGYRSVPPVLAVEVAGRDEGEPELREKACWYLDHGVRVVWIILPSTREVIAASSDTEARFTGGQRVAPDQDLPDLEPEVDRIFRRLG